MFRSVLYLRSLLPVFLLLVSSAVAQTHVPVSGYEVFLGSNCVFHGQPATCGATFTGWTGGGTSWVGFPGSGLGVWSLQINYTGHPSLPGQVTVVGGNWSFLFVNGLELRGKVVSGTVTWPDEGSAGCGGVVNAGWAQAILTVNGGANATVSGCLHDIPAGTVIPPTVWGFFNF
jgi:hypothetical protein